MSLITQESPLAVLPGLATRIGANGALILQQIHYWLEKSKHIIDGCKWIYNSYESWQRQFPFISLRTIKREIAALRILQLIRVEKFQKHRWNQTNWYTIDYERLKALSCSTVSNLPNQSGQIVPLDCAKLSLSITETSIQEISNTTTPTNHPVLKKDKQGRTMAAPGSAVNTLEKKSAQAISHQGPNRKGQEVVKPLKSQQIHKPAKPVVPKCHTEAEPTKIETNSNPDQVTPAAAEPFLKQVEGLGIRLNQNLRKLVLGATVETIKNALGVLKQGLESQKPVKNPPGLLAEAIKQGWKPSQAQAACTPQRASVEFTEWFNLARELRLVSASELRDGVQYVYSPDGRGQPWEMLTVTYPVERLRLLVEQKRQEVQELGQTRVKPSLVPLEPLNVVDQTPGLRERSTAASEVEQQREDDSQNAVGQSPAQPAPILLAEFKEWVGLALEAGIISDSNVLGNEMFVYSSGSWHEWIEFSAMFTTRYLRRQLKEGAIIRRE